MTEREKIFERIREALRVPALHAGHTEASVGNRSPSPAAFRQVLPKSGNRFEELLSQFQRVSADLKAFFHRVDNKEQAAALIQKIQGEEHWTSLALHRGSLIESVLPQSNLPRVYTDKPYHVRELEQCTAALSECDALIAQTGSVLVTTRSAGGRALSVLPPHHIVLASAQQLVADLPEAFALLRKRYAPDYPSFISFITGPSRTGDIERILVLGAHGPKKLTIILILES